MRPSATRTNGTKCNTYGRTGISLLELVLQLHGYWASKQIFLSLLLRPFNLVMRFFNLLKSIICKAMGEKLQTVFSFPVQK